MDMIFCPLYSGSSGNALFVQYGGTRLLIDAGKSGKMITEALDMIGVDPKTLDGILVTHEHTDHIAGVGVLARKFKLPVYATEATWNAMDEKVGKMPEGVRKVIALLIKIVEMAGIGVLVYLAWVLTEKVGDRKLVALGIPYVYLDLAYLLGMALMFVYSVVGFVKQLLSFRKHETKTEAE